MADNSFYLLGTKPPSWISGSLCDLLWPPCWSDGGQGEEQKEAATGRERQQKTGCNLLPGYNTAITRPFKTGLDITAYFVKTGLMLWVELWSPP